MTSYRQVKYVCDVCGTVKVSPDNSAYRAKPGSWMGLEIPSTSPKKAYVHLCSWKCVRELADSEEQK